MCDGLVELFNGPVFRNLHWAACGAIIFQHGACGMLLGKATWAHQTTSWHIFVRLTLLLCESFHDLLKGGGTEFGAFGLPAGGAGRSLVSAVAGGLWVVASGASIGACGGLACWVFW